jgi:diguanylate cyclase (GGDEF)-like protein/PAS domain S-box-containing protein
VSWLRMRLTRLMTDASLPARSAALPLRRLALALVAGNVAIIVLLLLAAGLALRTGRASEESRARESAENLANGLAIELGAELKQLDNALATIAMRVHAVDTTSADGRTEVERSLAEQRSLLPQVDGLWIADENGNVRFGLDAEAPATNIADRDHFQQAKAHDGMVVSEPIQGRIVRKWVVAVARRLQRADGSFAGVAFTNLSSDHFLERFRHIALGSAGAASLRSGGLRLVTRYSVLDGAQEKNIGTLTISEEMTRRLAADPERGSYLTPTALDGIERYTAYQRVPGCTLRVFVGLGTSDFLAGWRREAAQLSALLAVAIAAIAGFSALLFAQQRRQVIARREIARLAQEQSVMLDNEVVGMVKVKNRTALWKNRALDRIFGYEPHELVGAPLRRLYLDDATFDEIGALAYPVLATGGRYSRQLRMRHKQGHALWIELNGAAVSADESLWSMTDITVLKDSEAHAQHLALHDPMTGLPNRRLFAERLLYILADAQRRRQLTGVCYLDLDGFKAVNDALGHDAGDAVLREVGKRLLACIRTNDVVARFGGDEFALVLSNIQDAREVERVLQRVLHAIEQPVLLPGGETARVGASIGVAIAPEHGDASDALMAHADRAMYMAKRAGKHRVCLWSAEVEA